MADDKEQWASPHEAIFFILSYLPLYELLVMTQVCKSLRDAINNDVLPWLKIIVDRPINFRLTDDILMRVSSKSNGRLQLLALMNCVKITDDGLLRVVEQNPHISKLHVPGCRSLSPEGVIAAVKLLTQNKHYKLNTLQISGIYGFQKEHLDTLHNLIIHNHQTQKQKRQKVLYHEYKKSSTKKQIETDCSIDVDVCPKCNDVRMIFDCVNAVCGYCRGCELCVTRCMECGICISSDHEFEDVLCADALCTECWLKGCKCNFCNKPYCSLHAHLQHWVEGEVGFVCDACHSEFN